jgi:predicted NBD/HSP70 family sugar kinase
MFLLFDIGGTKMRLAVSEDGTTLKEEKTILTPKMFEEGMKEFSAVAKSFKNFEKIKAVAGGIAGAFNKERSILITSPHLMDWENKPLKTELEKVLGVPVYCDNDAVMAGLGEANVGAGKGYEIVMYMTVSTGVGGSRIVNGKVDPTVFGFEPGRQIANILDLDEAPVFAEDIISGSAMEKQYGKKSKEITDPKVWEEEAKRLAHVIHNSIVHWSPNIVVLGGSMIIGDPAIEIARVQAYLGEILRIYPEIPELKKAKLGDVGGLYGAIEYIKQRSS